ncbi:hypothetical protein RHMOL_Rhmol10G0070200 [Rhododendron molle]|uniref:Uncharacterized protein n=1 Tax=Rhododendron molle TaxID=49168 RepID=A0ACC0M0T0_RHOML|nr:hypothetical protein RHMOL_Rhmol10G0070200 [Rhododendron molle]
MENKGTAIEGIELPEELLIEIFSCLPVKTLLRFKTLSKPIRERVMFTPRYSLVRNRRFISLHHAHALRRLDLGYKWFMYLVPNQTLIHHLDLSFTMPHLRHLCHRGSCNGLTCISDYSNIVICNPATREYRPLPRPFYPSWRTFYLGFAFDSETNDYIVLRIAGLATPIDIDHEIQIYGMRVNSWKVIDVMVPNHDFAHYDPCTLLDGVFYWLIWLADDFSTNVRVNDFSTNDFSSEK